MIFLVIGVLGVLAVLAAAANHHYHWAAGWRYDWARAKHLVQELDQAGALSTRAAWNVEYEHGSMNLDEEKAFRQRPGLVLGLRDGEPAWLPAPDWREQTAADLAPEALNDQPDPYLDAIAAGHVSEYDEDDCLMECDPDCESGPYHCWWIHQPSHKRGWHSLADCPHDSGPGSSSSVAPGPDWLDGQLAVLYEWVRDQYAAAAA